MSMEVYTLEMSMEVWMTYRSHVYGGSGLVHDEDATLPYKCSGQAEELPLALTEVLPTLRHHRI